MARPKDPEELAALLRSLADLPGETEWVEFKHNKADREDIGEYISALANSAALNHAERGYLVWGVEDKTHRLLGTTFKPRKTKVGNEDLEPWLSRSLDPSVPFIIHEFNIDELPFVIFEIHPASHTPVKFKDVGYFRVGSSKKKLKDFHDRERLIWLQTYQEPPYETVAALPLQSSDEVLRLLDVAAYFDLTGQPFPKSAAHILHALSKDGFVRPTGPDTYDITNMGALLLAKDLLAFGRLERKGVRVLAYEGKSRIGNARAQKGRMGYANGFRHLVEYVVGRLPANEHVHRALRRETKMYPEVALRELIANAIIHQDFNAATTGPIVEIFEDRIEISNPGKPLIDADRFLDAPPKSRNDTIVAFMNRAGICEERGCGIDRVFGAVEAFQLPPPDFVVAHNYTKAILFAYRKYSDMSKEERIRACYQHAGLLCVSGQQMTNTTLRDRLGISAKNYSMWTRRSETEPPNARKVIHPQP